MRVRARKRHQKRILSRSRTNAHQQAPAEETEPKGASRPVAGSGKLRPGEDRSRRIPRPPLEPAKVRSRPNGSAPAPLRGSRWVDYDTHELLEMIGELEDERRWSRLREGFWLALLVHILFFSAITWIPTYIFKVPKVVDPFDAIKQAQGPFLSRPAARRPARDSTRRLRPSRCPSGR